MSSQDTRPVWLDEDWFDTLAEALNRTGRPGLAEAFREKWDAAPEDAVEAAAGGVANARGHIASNRTDEDRKAAKDVLRALGMPS